jgi:hypothetical protein
LYSKKKNPQGNGNFSNHWNFSPPASLEEQPRKSELFLGSFAIPFVIAVLPATGQPLSTAGLRSLTLPSAAGG